MHKKLIVIKSRAALSNGTFCNEGDVCIWAVWYSSHEPGVAAEPLQWLLRQETDFFQLVQV